MPGHFGADHQKFESSDHLIKECPRSQIIGIWILTTGSSKHKIKIMESRKKTDQKQQIMTFFDLSPLRSYDHRSYFVPMIRTI